MVRQEMLRVDMMRHCDDVTAISLGRKRWLWTSSGSNEEFTSILICE